MQRQGCILSPFVFKTVYFFGEIVGADPCGSPDDGQPQGIAPTIARTIAPTIASMDKHRPELILNDAGKMIETEWLNLKNRFTNIELHEYVTMPNHFHGILEITSLGDPCGRPKR